MDRAEEVRRRLQSVVHEVVDFTIETADRYTQIRATLGIAPADAIHLASAAQAGADLFLTNHKRLAGKFVQGIQFMTSLEDDIL
jgi:predicted nucleic acid-binding protein